MNPEIKECLGKVKRRVLGDVQDRHLLQLLEQKREDEMRNEREILTKDETNRIR